GSGSTPGAFVLSGPLGQPPGASQSEGHDGQDGVEPAIGHEHRRVHDPEVVMSVHASPWVRNRAGRIVPHPARSRLMLAGLNVEEVWRGPDPAGARRSEPLSPLLNEEIRAPLVLRMQPPAEPGRRYSLSVPHLAGARDAVSGHGDFLNRAVDVARATV